MKRPNPLIVLILPATLVLAGIAGLIINLSNRDAVPNSCVLVYNDCEWSGSGSIVGPNTVLTAGHCIRDNAFSHVLTRDGKAYIVTKVQYDPNDDAALLTVSGTFAQRPLAQSPHRAFVAQGVVIWGTPYDPQYFPCRLPGSVVRLGCPVMGMSPEITWTDSHADKGCSGSPVVDDCGRIVGVFVCTEGRLGGFVPTHRLNFP